MRTTDSRRFGIADGLILIAGVAAGLGSFRALAPDLTPQKIWDAFVRPKPKWRQGCRVDQPVMSARRAFDNHEITRFETREPNRGEASSILVLIVFS